MVITQQQYQVMLRDSRELYIKIDLLDFLTDRKLEEIQGVCIDGSISINGRSNIRSTAKVEFVIKDSSFLVGEDKKFWLDKKIKIDIGLKDIVKNEIMWFNQGYFIINSPTISILNNTVSFEALDYMSLVDGTFRGKLGRITEILIGTNISDAIKSTIEKLIGISKINIEQSPYTVPYTIKRSSTDTAYDLIKELAELYMDWEFFFDENGVFTFQRIRNKLNNPTIWNFSETEKLVTDCSVTMNFPNIANDFYIWGRLLDNGTQIKYFKQNNEDGNPFRIEKIGIRPFVYDNNKLFTQEQAEARGNFEYMNHSNLNEQLNLQCLPIYSLRANEMIEYNKEEKEIVGKYLTDTLTIPLVHTGTMSIQAYKIYN